MAGTTIPPVSSAPSRSSFETATDPEKQREAARSSNPNGFVQPTSGVSVAAAEAEFASLQKELTNISRATRKSEARARGEGDVEKVSSTSTASEPFDLEGTLRGNREADEVAGIRAKKIGVLWDGLTVRGHGGVANFVKTFPDAFTDFFNVWATGKQILGLGSKGREVDILKGFRGLVKPGEMVLVLGRPGSGCTTFLKVIANQRFGYTGVEGDVLYGPFDAKTFGKQYRGEAVYNQEDDVHHPTLTVGQTLEFALDTKIPGKRPEGMTKGHFKERVVQTLLKMFNIEHTVNTVVGSAFVRGISGGERKRVSIAEMMVTGATVCAWDNSTRGLDASTALDYAKSLRIMTNIYQATTFVSLYQASENIYKQFDKVLVIDSGRQAFFGPADQARGYFESLGFKEKPRQTTPDFLTGCTDEFEREYVDGYGPHTPDTLAQAFTESSFTQSLTASMDTYKASLEPNRQSHEDFRVAVHESKRGLGTANSVYSVPFYLQVWALMRRQFLIKWQDKFQLCVSWGTSLVIAIVVGTTWLNIPQTSAGAFTRGGVLFISFLFNCFQAFGELASTMLGRPIVNKHRAYTFHRPSALWIAQIAVDLSFAAMQIFLFSLVVYFLCNLARDAGAFFTFYIVIVLGYLTMTLFFRVIGCVCPDFDYAIKFAVITITFFVLTTGYLIQYDSQKVWLRWIFWINPFGLGFSSLMANEFSRIDLTCSGPSLIPNGPGYGNISHQRLLPDYQCRLRRGAELRRWRKRSKDLRILVVLSAFFLTINVVSGEVLNFGAGGNAAKTFAHPTKETDELNAALVANREARRNGKTEAASSDLKIESKAILTWEGLNYDVPTPSGQLRLLNNIYGYVKPGELTALMALMGASGAGKTTLLDVLASRKNIGVISGDVLVDGLKPGTAFQRGTSYAEQLDVHEPTQTVREALRFSADLRQPIDVPRSEKYAYVEEILSLLEMEDMADAIIGDPESGLAVEQRKRVTIGVELAAKPELLLFLDEPTSGLDSQSAFNIVRFLKKLAAAGQAILCTIHQPNAALFENFDRLLLLQRGGRCVYFGDIGSEATTLLDYFHRHGADFPADANPAETMLDAIGAGQAARVGDHDWADLWAESPELAAVKAQITSMKATRMAEVGAATETADSREFATPLMHQLRIVQARTNLSFWRSPNYGFTRLFNHVVIGLVTGLMYLNLNSSRASLQYRVFVMFQVTVLPAIVLSQVEPKYAISRTIFYREASSKMYSQFAFATSLIVAEMPYSILCAVAFFLPLYYMPGFSSEPTRAGYQFLITLITELFSVTLGQMIAALTPSPYIAVLLNPFVIITFALFCGVTIPPPAMPAFWRTWLYELDPFTRLIGGMAATELTGREVVCGAQELNRFVAPIGQTCGEYMAAFFEAGGAGYLVSDAGSNCGAGYLVSDAGSNCEFCAFKNGEQFLEGMEMYWVNRWRDLGIFTAFVASNIIILLIASRYLNFNRRTTWYRAAGDKAAR
ncbi:hypothetical protein V498_00053 [Pseudogymnoascus sp. VKM F-4517 (FW-2822)]|nr:hypothetical protein V498_00053 [Pseudogymnoascus sp. VKM F-4517 (FW-2822)]